MDARLRSEYLAPEILNRTGHGRAADWWSLGALVYEMLTGMPPFYSRDRDRLFQKILTSELQFPRNVSQEAKVRRTIYSSFSGGFRTIFFFFFFFFFSFSLFLHSLHSRFMHPPRLHRCCCAACCAATRASASARAPTTPPRSRRARSLPTWISMR